MGPVGPQADGHPRRGPAGPTGPLIGAGGGHGLRHQTVEAAGGVEPGTADQARCRPPPGPPAPSPTSRRRWWRGRRGDDPRASGPDPGRRGAGRRTAARSGPAPSPGRPPRARSPGPPAGTPARRRRGPTGRPGPPPPRPRRDRRARRSGTERRRGSSARGCGPRARRPDTPPLDRRPGWPTSHRPPDPPGRIAPRTAGPGRGPPTAFARGTRRGSPHRSRRGRDRTAGGGAGSPL